MFVDKHAWIHHESIHSMPESLRLVNPDSIDISHILVMRSQCCAKSGTRKMIELLLRNRSASRNIKHITIASPGPTKLLNMTVPHCDWGKDK